MASQASSRNRTQRDMKPMALADFVNPVRVSTHDRQWETFVAWNRAGLLRMQPDPKFRDMATLVLSDRGRNAIDTPDG